jgi:hypothetical protein
MSSRLGSKLRSENHGIELSSLDEEVRGGKLKEIKVQTETTIEGSPKRAQHEKFGGWSESSSGAHGNKLSL